MNPASIYISATEARSNFFALLEKTKNNPFPINITVKGVPQAVIINKEDYEAWQATIETLSDPALMKQITEAEVNFKKGNYQTLDEVEKELKTGKYKPHVSSILRKQSQKRTKKT